MSAPASSPAARAARAPLGALVAVAACLVAVGAAVASERAVPYVAGAAILVSVLAVGHERLLGWRSLLSLTILAILFVPIRRYSLPGSLPIDLEVYRLVVAFLVLGWLTSLLVDDRVRARASGLEAPLVAFLVAVVLSLVLNPGRVGDLGGSVVKAVSFLASFVLVFFVVVSLVRRPAEIDFLVRLLVLGGAALGALAVVESATGYNPFNHLASVAPIMQLHADQIPASAATRGGGLRAYASAQHPIALGAAMAMLLPLAVYRISASSRHRLVWWVAAALIVLGLLASRSRTPIVMLVAEMLVYLVLRRGDVVRLLPRILPAAVAVFIGLQLVLPGTLAAITDAFSPSGGLVAEQQQGGVGSARLTTLGPALRDEFLPNPILGEGYGTRVIATVANAGRTNAPILDDQWLGTLLETGVAGVAALAWFLARFVRRTGSAGKRDPSPRGLLLIGSAAAVTAFAVSMLTYDAFSFIQATFLLYIVLGLGVSTLLAREQPWSTG